MTKIQTLLKTKKRSDLVFWPAFVLLLTIHCIENTSLTYTQPGWLKTMYLFRNLLYLVLLAKAIFLTQYRAKELWAILGVLGLAGVCFICSDDFTLLEFAIVAIAAKDIPKRQLLLVFMGIKGISVMLTLLLSDLSLLPKLYYIHNDAPLDTLGFCHRNVLGSNMAVLCLSWLYLRFRRLHWADIGIWLVLTVVTYFLAISRSSLIIMLGSIALMVLVRIFGPRIRSFPHTGKILAGAFLAMFLLSLLGTLFFEEKDPLWELLDDFLSKRLSFAQECFVGYGIAPFGQEIPFVGTMESILTDAHRLILDNSYMRALILDGAFPGGLFLSLYLVCLVRSWRRNNLGLSTCLLVIGIYGLSESFMLDVFYSFPMLLGCMSLFRKPTPEEAWKPLPYAWHILQPWYLRLRWRLRGKR